MKYPTTNPTCEMCGAPVSSVATRRCGQHRGDSRSVVSIKRMSAEYRKRIAECYAFGYPLVQLVATFKISSPTIVKIARECGVAVRPVGRPRKSIPVSETP